MLESRGQKNKGDNAATLFDENLISSNRITNFIITKIHKFLYDEVQNALFKGPVRTAQ
jgi:hypothetical protein